MIQLNLLILQHKKIISKSMDKVNKKNNENEILLEDNNQNYSSINTNRKIINLNNYNTIINGIINLNSPLGKVYTKCVNNIKIGEKIIKNIDEEKSKSDEENKMKENKFKFHLRQLKDKALFDKLKKTEFDKKIEKKMNEMNPNIDAYKISNKIAYDNRKEYFKVFGLNFLNDKDFLFKNELIKEIKEKIRFNKHCREIALQNKNSEIDKMLEQNLKGKKILLERLNRDKIKYHTKDYFFNNKNEKKNLKTINNTSDYLIKKIKLLKQDKFQSQNISLNIKCSY
jgi:hypothetical protein